MDDPLAAALCRTLDDSAWLDLDRAGHRAREAVEACRSCPALAACIDHTGAEVERGLVPSGVVQAALVWPSPQLPKQRALDRLAEQR